MKKAIAALLLIMTFSANAYMLNGIYARLITCEWKSYLGEFGYVGTYEIQTFSGPERYTVFFGNTYCQH